jgi:hypothetical protein
MTIEKAVGQELCFWRTKKGLSQEKLFQIYIRRILCQTNS